MAAEKEDQQLFYKLINKQRETPQQSTSSITMEGIEQATQEEIMEGWKIHFQNLATPTDQNSNIDKSFEEQVFLNDLIIHQR